MDDEFIIENKLRVENNVKSYTLENFSDWKIEYHKEIEGVSVKKYFIIENQCGSDAFAHWCFESAIYLPIFKELKKFCPDLKLILIDQMIDNQSPAEGEPPNIMIFEQQPTTTTTANQTNKQNNKAIKKRN